MWGTHSCGCKKLASGPKHRSLTWPWCWGLHVGCLLGFSTHVVSLHSFAEPDLPVWQWECSRKVRKKPWSPFQYTWLKATWIQSRFKETGTRAYLLVRISCTIQWLCLTSHNVFFLTSLNSLRSHLFMLDWPGMAWPNLFIFFFLTYFWLIHCLCLCIQVLVLLVHMPWVFLGWQMCNNN